MLAACGGDDDSTGGEAGTDQAGQTDDGDGELAESRTLKLWHYEGPNSAMGIAWNRAIEIFEETHPGVTVEFEEKGFEQIQDTAQMVLNSQDGPDIMEYNKGNATAGLLSSQGLLADLSEEAEARGWSDMLSSSLQTTAIYDDGVMGSGNWYGVPNYGEFVLVYYNQDMFDQYGVEVPTTLEEFEQVMDTFVAEGVTPLSVGGAEYPAQQIFYQLTLTNADRDFVNAFQLYEGEVDFHGPEFTGGAEKFTEWMDAGYISEDAIGIPAEDMGVAFTSGEYPILISGTWWFGRFVEEITDFEWGTFLFPGTDLHLGSSGNLWVVSEKSENKDLAYDFIDITMSEEVQNLLGNSGGIPVAADPGAITDERSRELIESFNSIVENDGLAFYPDWPAPGYYDALVAAVQDLMGGHLTVDEFLDNIESAYHEGS